MQGSTSVLSRLMFLCILALAAFRGQSEAGSISHKALKDIRIYIEFETAPPNGYSNNTSAQGEFRQAARMAMRMWQSVYPSMNVTWVNNPLDANITFIVGNYAGRLPGTNSCGLGNGPSTPGWVGCSFPPNGDGDIAGGKIYFNTSYPATTPFLFEGFTKFSRGTLYESYRPATLPPEEHMNLNIAGGMGWINGRFGLQSDAIDATHIIVHEFGHSLDLGHDIINPLPFYGIPYPQGGTQGTSPNLANGTGYPYLPPRYYGGNSAIPWVSDLKPLAVRRHQMAIYQMPPVNPMEPTILWQGIPDPSLQYFNFRVISQDLYNHMPFNLKAKAGYPTTTGTIRLERHDGTPRLQNSWDHAIQDAQLNVPTQSFPFMVTGVYPYSQTQRFALGSYHTLSIRNDGTLWAWGDNSKGQLGDNSVTQRNLPVKIGTSSNWVAVAAGVGFSLGLRSDNSLWAWGDRTYGQVGDGIFDAVNFVRTPKKIGDGWVSISAGPLHGMGLKTDGTLWSWGYNGSGQHGTGNSSNSASPVQEYNRQKDWVAVSAGSNHALAAKADGTLWSWGLNEYGALGNGTTISSSYPAQVSSGKTDWAMIKAAHEHSMATDNSGRVWTWGRNQFGQIAGSGNSSIPAVRVSFDPAFRTYMKIAAGQVHSSAIRKDGTIWSWGLNSNGQLGANLSVGGAYSTPVQEAFSSTKWKEIAGATFYSAGQSDEGRLWMWGDNSKGQFGNGTATSAAQNAPVKSAFCPELPVITSFSTSPESVAPATVYLGIYATGCVKRVEFYEGGTKIAGCDQTSAPYICYVTNVGVGSHSYTARVVDSMDVAVTSAVSVANVQQLRVIGRFPATGNVDLNAEGTVNWKHFPANTRKSGQPDNLVLRGPLNVISNISSPTFSWSNGTPTATKTGEVRADLIRVPFSTANSYSVDFPSTTTVRRARVYFAASRVQVEIKARFDVIGPPSIKWTAPTSTGFSQYFEVEYRTFGDNKLTIDLVAVDQPQGGWFGVQAALLR